MWMNGRPITILAGDCSLTFADAKNVTSALGVRAGLRVYGSNAGDRPRRALARSGA